MSKHDLGGLKKGGRPGPRVGFVQGMVGFLAAAYVVVGRWTPAQLVGEERSTLIIEPRLWLVIGLLTLALAPVRYSRNAAAAGSRGCPEGPGALLTFALLTYMFSSVLWALAPEAAVIKAYELVLMIVATLSLYRILHVMDASAIVSAFWQWIIILTGLLALAAIPAAACGGRLAILGGGPNVFGRLMALLYLAAICRLMESNRPFVWSSVVVVALILALLSGSRGAMISLVAATIFFCLVYRANYRRILVIALVCASTALLAFLYTPIGTLMTESVHVRITALIVDQVNTSGRDVIYESALDLFKEHPLLGVGLGGFHSNTGWSYPHNIFLELLCEGGLVALGLFIATMTAYSFAMWKKGGRLERTSLTALIMILVASQFSGDLYDARAIFLLPLFVLALTPQQVRRARRERGKPSPNGPFVRTREHIYAEKPGPSKQQSL